MTKTELCEALDDIVYGVRVRAMRFSGQCGAGCTWYARPDPENPQRTCRQALEAYAYELIGKHDLGYDASLADYIEICGCLPDEICAKIAEDIIKEDQAGLMMRYID